MEKKKKKEYVAPVTDPVELQTERILCVSGGDYPQWGNGGNLF